jgi:hypothetical protein
MRLELGAYRGRGDVGEVGSNTRSVDNIVQSQLVDERAALEEQGQGLCEDGKGRAELATRDTRGETGCENPSGQEGYGIIPVQCLQRRQQQLS